MIYNGISPIAFTIGSFSVRWYGIMVALAVLTLLVWALFWARKDPKIRYDTIITAAIVGIPSGYIFSRLLHVAEYWDRFYPDNLGAIFGGQGLTIYGAVLGAALGIWIYSRFSKFNFGYLADMLAPGIILAQAIGRVGCTLNGCCYGIECDLPWAIVYEHPESLAPLGVPVHPTQIYEIIYNLIAFGILLLLRKRFRPDGSLFMIYLSLYAVWRLGIGFIREGQELLWGLHEAQLISIVVLVVTITLMAWRTRWVKRDEIDIEE